jgi:parallel beta-helix repeat protein
MEVTGSEGAIDVTQSKAACDKVASSLGSDINPGTTLRPYATVDRLADSLQAGQTGCLREGVFQGDVKFLTGGVQGAPITLTSYPGERATVIGRIHVSDTANNVVVQQLDLDGRNAANLPSPTVNGDNAVFRDNDVTNHHTTICFLLGSAEYGRARNTVIERNRIHNCGQLPPTNHHHGIYVEEADGARIVDNWIYDNADRGVQLFPDAQRTYVAGNVIDGNGQGVVFSRESSNNVVENNLISNPVVRYNIEDFELTGRGNVARRNCVWSARHPGFAGIQPDIAVPLLANVVVQPAYVSRTAKDFRLEPGTACTTVIPAPAPPGPAAAEPRSKRVRPVVLRSGAASVWPGGKLRLRAIVTSPNPPARTPAWAILKVRRGQSWRRAGRMRLRGNEYRAIVRLGGTKREEFRQFGRTRVSRGARALKLRVLVPGVGISNLVLVQIARRPGG